MSSGGSRKAIFAAFAANLGIAVAKLIGFVVTGSSSMLAESIHSLADTGNQALLMVGGKRSQRPEDDDHQFGYGRERFFYAFIVALVLFTLGAAFAIYEGIHKVLHPEVLESPSVAIVILLVAIVLEGLSLRTAVAEATPLRGADSWGNFIRRSKNPELPVLLLEDIGALVGLGIAFVALLLAWKVDPVFDGVGTIAIGALLGVIAWVLAVEMKSLLIGESATEADRGAISAAIGASPDVLRVIHLRTEHVGPEDLLVGVKVEFARHLSVAQLSEAIDVVEKRVRDAVPQATFIFIEPDVFRDSGPAGGGAPPASV